MGAGVSAANCKLPANRSDAWSLSLQLHPQRHTQYEFLVSLLMEKEKSEAKGRDHVRLEGNGWKEI